MTRSDEMRKRRQRAAYDDYVRLQWQFYRLARDHPARAALAEAVRVAEQHWRTLMQSLGTVGTAPREAVFMSPVEPLVGIHHRGDGCMLNVRIRLNNSTC